MPRKRTEEDYRRANEKMVQRIKEHDQASGRQRSDSEVRKEAARVGERVSRDRAASGADQARPDAKVVQGQKKIVRAVMNVADGGKDKPKRWI